MLKEAVNDYAETLNKKWDHDRTKTVGASEIGQCARKVFGIKNKGTRKGMPPDDDYEDQWGARIRGTIMEDAFWQPAMQARYGENLLYSGTSQRTLQLGLLSATPDGLIINQPRDALKELGIKDIGADCFMAECKTIDPRTNLVEAKTENFFQVQVQMGLMRELTEYKPVYDVLTYSDASFWSEVIEYPIEFEPAVYQAAKDRATIIMTADSAVDLPPEGWIAGGKECSFCPFVKACGVERRSVPRENKKVTPQFVAEITEYALEANEARASILHLETAERKLQQLIKDRMREKSARRIQGVVNWYEVKGATRYSAKDMKQRLIELGEDVEEFASVSDPTDRLVITPIPKDGVGVKLLPAKLTKKGKSRPVKQTKTVKSKKQTVKSKTRKTKR